MRTFTLRLGRRHRLRNDEVHAMEQAAQRHRDAHGLFGAAGGAYAGS